MKKLVLAIVIALTSMAVSTTASAGVLWSKAGAACTPDWLSFSNYATSAGAVSDKSGVSQLIAMYCPVNVPISGATSLTLTYSDGSMASTEHVFATYYKVSRTTGTVTAIQSVDSKVSPCTMGGPKSCSVTFSDTADFDNNYYYVEVQLVRATSTVTETFYGITLGN